MIDALPEPDAFDADEELSFDAQPPAPRKRRAPKGKPAAAAPPKPAATEAAAAIEAEPVVETAAPASSNADRRARMLLGGVAALSCLASFASFGAVATVGRTLAAAQADRAEAAAERRAVERLPATIAALDQATARLSLAADRLPRSSGAPGIGVDELHRGLDDLKIALAAHRPEGASALAGITQAGFAGTGKRLDRIEATLTALSAGRRAASGPYPRRPS